jgi:hypothetical protein
MYEATKAASEPVFISRSGAHVERFFLRSHQTSNLRLIDTFLKSLDWWAIDITSAFTLTDFLI